MKFFYYVLFALFLVGCADKSADVASSSSEVKLSPKKAEVVDSGSSESIESNETLDVVEDDKPEVKPTDSSFEPVYFGFDMYNIQLSMMPVLNKNVELMKNDVKIKLEGNTDSYGSDEYNFALGNKRALAVKDALIVRGIKRENITIVSYGETKPLCNEDTKECRQKNRRVEFKVVE